MKEENSTRKTGLYTTRRADGECPRRTAAKETWDPSLGRFRPVAPDDIPQELYDLEYPDNGYNRDDRYQTQCLRILRKTQAGKGIAGLPHQIRAYRSVNGLPGMSRLTGSATAKPVTREELLAREAVAGLRLKLAGRPELLSLLDSFDANGNGRFDFAAVAGSYGVSLATAYRWKDELAKAAKRP